MGKCLSSLVRASIVAVASAVTIATMSVAGAAASPASVPPIDSSGPAGARVARHVAPLPWPGRVITYYNAAERWEKTIDRAAAIWNRASVGIRIQRIGSRSSAGIVADDVPSVGAGYSGRATEGYGYRGWQGWLRLKNRQHPSSVTKTALHEWGHVLGLTHRNRRYCAVMVQGYAPACPQAGPRPWLTPCRQLQRDDIRRAAALYGGRGRLTRQFCPHRPFFSGTYVPGYEQIEIKAGKRMVGLAARVDTTCGSGPVQRASGTSMTVELPVGRGCVTLWGLYPGGNRSRAVTYEFERDPSDVPPLPLPVPVPDPGLPWGGGPPPRPLDEGFESPLDGRWLADTPGRWQRTSEAAAYGGSYSVADSPGALYPDNSDVSLFLVPPIDLAVRSDCWIVWYARYATEPGFDYLAVELRRSAADPWTEVGQHVSGTSDGYFHSFSAELDAFEGSATNQLRLRFVSDISIVDQGVEVDDLYVHCNS